MGDGVAEHRQESLAEGGEPPLLVPFRVRGEAVDSDLRDTTLTEGESRIDKLGPVTVLAGHGTEAIRDAFRRLQCSVERVPLQNLP